mmetsp:Transcript_78179/g.229123  ORF Transcript_78179/g.229123 Transcript_78179/m.229123 type:complete len:523 (-) Transcript_78179:92-1660(-)
MLAFILRLLQIVLLIPPASLSSRVIADRVIADDHDDLAPDSSVGIPDPKDPCLNRAEVVKAIAGVKSDPNWNCASWARLTAEMKRTKDTNKLQKWGELRKALVDNAFDCARRGSDAEISCPGSQGIDSDLDCNVQGSNPADVILKTARNIVGDLLGELKCSVEDPNQPLAVVEYFFDANFYGDLTSVDAGLMEKTGWWGGWGKPLLQAAMSKGRETYVLKELCSSTTEPLMRDKVLGRIREQVLRLAPPAIRQAPRPYNENAMMGALSSLYTNIQKGNFADPADRGKVQWAKLFTQLMDVAELQREAYLTPACTFKIVLAGQRGIQTRQAVPEDQAQCVDRISNLEQLAFIFQHISGEPSGGGTGGATTSQSSEAPLFFNFLCKSSKYFARMVDWGGSANCKELIQLSPQVKEKRAILTEKDELYTKYLNAFRQCATACEVKARRESDFGEGKNLGRLLEQTRQLPWEDFINLLDPKSGQSWTFNQLITLLWRLLHNMNGIVTWQARDNVPSFFRPSVTWGL